MSLTNEAFSRSLPEGSDFTCTRWSMILDARDGDEAEVSQALEYLCRRYWYPLYAYVRRKGYPAPDAEDIIQAFMARLLAPLTEAAADDSSSLHAEEVAGTAEEEATIKRYG